MPDGLTDKYIGYEDHFLGEKPLENLDKETQYFVNSYLYEVNKRTNNGYKANKSTLKHFLGYITEPIQEIRRKDIRDYFNDVLDKKEIKVSSKNTARANLMSFFDHVEDLLDDKEIEFNNPVPRRGKYKFTQHSRDIIKKSEKQEKILSKEQLLTVLDELKKKTNKTAKRNFIFFGLCVGSGARFSEIASIKINDINLEERYFETGFEKDARKSTLRTKESLIFFITETMGIYLENYINSLPKDSKWLFPSHWHNGKKHMDTSTFWLAIKPIRERLDFHFSIHYFRHSMITHLKRNECSRDDRELLLNHVPSSTEGKHYEHDDIQSRRAIFDKYFPYYNFPYF